MKSGTEKAYKRETIALLMLFIAGCVAFMVVLGSVFEPRNRPDFKRVRIGMSDGRAIRNLGEPDEAGNLAACENGADGWIGYEDFLFLDTEKGMLTVIFEENRVTGIAWLETKRKSEAHSAFAQLITRMMKYNQTYDIEDGAYLWDISKHRIALARDVDEASSAYGACVYMPPKVLSFMTRFHTPVRTGTGRWRLCIWLDL